MAIKRFFGLAKELPHLRQNLSDASQASVPLLQKNARSANDCSTSIWASCTEGIV